jgi:hypothetical protein
MTATSRFPARLLAGLLVAAAVLNGQAAQADTIWYNGDYDGRDALTNQTGPADGLVYDNFVVGAGRTLTITSVYSNNLMYYPDEARTAHWEIRSGVSAGDGGTLVASGVGVDNLTATGRFETVIPDVLDVYEYTNQVEVNVVLTAGTYWLAVAPDVSDQNSFISTTSGANAVGTPPGNDGNSFVSSSFFGWNFVPTSDDSIEGQGTWDYSMGVNGTLSSVPEPSAFLLGLVGLTAAAGRGWARRRNRA